MSKLVIIGAAALGILAAPVVAAAQTPAPAPAPAAAAAAKLSSQSTITALAASAPAKEVLKKHIPQVVEFLDGGGADVIGAMTLASLADIPEAGMSADTIKAIDADLSKLP